MWALLVVETNPVRYHPTRMLQRLKPLPVHTLLLDRTNDPLHQTVLLRAMRRDEFLLQAIAFNQPCVAAACEHQPVVASQQKRHYDSSKRAITVDQGLLQGRLCRARLGRSRQVPAQDLSGVAIDHHGQTRPTIASRPNAAQVRCPMFIGRLGYRGHGLNTGSKPNGPLLDLPPTNLEDALHRVLVEFEQARYRAVAKRRVLVNHGFDRRFKPLLNLGRRFTGFVVSRASGYFKPTA